MAALKPEVKAFIIQMLACYDTLSIVVDAVQKTFGIKVTSASRITRSDEG